MFEQSETIGELAKALVIFHKNMGVITKDNDNSFFKSKYADLASIHEATKQPLTEAGLSVVQFPVDGGIISILIHTSGEWMRAYSPMRPSKDDPQGVGSSITYNCRYSKAAILGLQIGDDDDGNAASIKPSTPQRPTLPHRQEITLEDVQETFTAPAKASNKLEAGTHLVQIQQVVNKEWDGKSFVELITDKGVGTIWDSMLVSEVQGRDGQAATVVVGISKSGKEFISNVTF